MERQWVDDRKFGVNRHNNESSLLSHQEIVEEVVDQQVQEEMERPKPVDPARLMEISGIKGQNMVLQPQKRKQAAIEPFRKRKDKKQRSKHHELYQASLVNVHGNLSGYGQSQGLDLGLKIGTPLFSQGTQHQLQGFDHTNASITDSFGDKTHHVKPEKAGKQKKSPLKILDKNVPVRNETFHFTRNHQPRAPSNT